MCFALCLARARRWPSLRGRRQGECASHTISIFRALFAAEGAFAHLVCRLVREHGLMALSGGEGRISCGWGRGHGSHRRSVPFALLNLSLHMNQTNGLCVHATLNHTINRPSTPPPDVAGVLDAQESGATQHDGKVDAPRRPAVARCFARTSRSAFTFLVVHDCADLVAPGVSWWSLLSTGLGDARERERESDAFGSGRAVGPPGVVQPTMATPGSSKVRAEARWSTHGSV